MATIELKNITETFGGLVAPSNLDAPQFIKT